MDRTEIRKSIKKGGFDFYKSLPYQLKNIAGEFMSLNEDYVLNNQGDMTLGVHSILKRGFTQNQEVLLQDALKHYKK